MRAYSGSDEEQQAPAATGWRGWLEKAAAPLQAYREHSAKAAVKAERVNVLNINALSECVQRGNAVGGASTIPAPPWVRRIPC